MIFWGQNQPLRSNPRVRDTHVRVGRDRKVSLNIWNLPVEPNGLALYWQCRLKTESNPVSGTNIFHFIVSTD